MFLWSKIYELWSSVRITTLLATVGFFEVGLRKPFATTNAIASIGFHDMAFDDI